MKNTVFKKLISAVLALTLVFCLTLSVYAVGEGLNKGSLTINLTDKSTKEPIKDITFKLYYVAENIADVNNPEYKYSSDFEKCSAKLDVEDSYLPVYLAFYAQKNNINYEKSVTDENGTARFYNLKEGLYLVSSNHMMVMPFFFSIPEKEGNELRYDVTAMPKSDVAPETDEKQNIEVEKLWRAENHPESIVAVLLKDGKEFAQVVLNEENNWSAKWEGLTSGSSWQVVEKDVPDGFNVKYETEGNKFIIINTADSIIENETETQTELQKEDDDVLADTGELNWPVPVMAISGILIFSIGWVLLNLKKKSV